MGKKSRERIRRILAGEEIARSGARNMPRKVRSDKRVGKLEKDLGLSGTQVKDKVVNVGVSVVKSYSISNQVKFLADSLHSGQLTPSKLRKALEDNAHKEMHKGAEKLTKKGRDVTVELLLDEYRKDAEFQKLATEVGLDEKWFTDLAESECRRWRTD